MTWWQKVGAILAVIAAVVGIIVFIGAGFDQALTARLDYALNLRWEKDDATRHENIVERLDRMETKLDYLIGAGDARER